MIIDYDYLAKEYMKCFKDRTRIYMIQNYLKTFDNTQKMNVPFHLFPRQQDLCATLGKANNIVTTKPRQAGITTTVAAFIACEMILADEASPQTALVIGNSIDLAQQMLVKIKDFLLQFPLWMWGDAFMDIGYNPMEPPTNKKTIFEVCNTKELKLKNGCKVVARSSGPDASRGVGGVQYLIFDEAAFIVDGKDVYASALPTVSTGGHIIMISTPNGKDQLYYETCRQAKLKGTNDWNNFELVELKWYQDPRYNKNLTWTRKNETTGEIDIETEPTVDDEGNIAYDEEHWENMVKEGWKPRSPWYVKMCKQFNNDTMKIAQELDVSFLGSAANVVEPEFIQMQQELNQRDPIGVDMMIEDTWIWKQPVEGHRYVCACIPEGENIKTRKGVKKIETITPYDELLDEKGNYVKIVECKRRPVVNEDVISIRVSNFYKPMKFTHNHPVLCSHGKLERCYSKNNPLYVFNERYRNHDFEFREAVDISVGDWLKLPNIYKHNRLCDDEIAAFLQPYNLQEIYDLELFWWYCGIWTAEGCIWNNNINTTHSITETFIHEKVLMFLKKINEKYALKYDKKCNTINIRFSNKNIQKFLTENIGRGSKNKFISEFIKKLPDKYREHFINGYFSGDGSLYENKRDGMHISFGSVSFQLLSDLQDILFSKGIISNLSLSKETHIGYIQGRYINCSNLYELKICKTYTEKYFNNNSKIKHPISHCYFSKDEEFIFFKVKQVSTEKYSGYVYNFETETHTYCSDRCISHNCDPSRGDAADRTAIEILDMDGIDDETGEPILEQVLEYHGKATGDVVGELIYKYAVKYNNAFTIIDAIGGVGDAAILTLMNLGYKNLYYDDPELKNYTMQNDASSLKVTNDGKLPGFHSSSVRFQMLTNFANMVKTNQFKIRSKRVIAELDTWIYKGAARRIDHQDGCHDDTLTCLAMGIFVMLYSMKKIIEAANKNKAILGAWCNGSTTIKTSEYNKKEDEKPKKSYAMPFYTNSTLNKGNSGQYGWLIR